MGRAQHTNETGGPTSNGPATECFVAAVGVRGRRLGWRRCLRKGCGRRFRARRYNQRYCREPECLNEVHRWQAAKRQRKRRADPAGRQRHAEAERQRRRQKALQADGADRGEVSATDAASDTRAWSRSNSLPEIICDRPGCYEPPRDSPRRAASYCSDDCRTAVDQARDRERKWLRRKREAGRFKRHLEYEASKARRRQGPAAPGDSTANRCSAHCDPSLHAVLDYRGTDGSRLGCEASEEVNRHDSQEGSASRPRAPPAP